MVHEKASVEHEVPGIGRRRLSESYLRKWLTVYLKRGKEGLRPRERRDVGSSRVLSANEAALLLSTLESKPALTASAVLRLLQGWRQDWQPPFQELPFTPGALGRLGACEKTSSGGGGEEPEVRLLRSP
jgi:hypothetical protein